MPWKYNGQVVSETKGFKKTDGYTTPRNWVTVCDDTEKKNQGLTWEEPATPTVSDAQKLRKLCEAYHIMQFLNYIYEFEMLEQK